MFANSFSVIPISIVGAHRFYDTLTNFLGLIGYWASCFIAVIVTEHLVFRAHPRRFFQAVVSAKHPSTSGERQSTATHGTLEPFVLSDAFDNYDLSIWDSPKDLPSGIPAIGACVLSFGLIVPGMNQVWFTGPIGKTTGDIGFELAFLSTVVCYIPLRSLEFYMKARNSYLSRGVTRST